MPVNPHRTSKSRTAEIYLTPGPRRSHAGMEDNSRYSQRLEEVAHRLAQRDHLSKRYHVFSAHACYRTPVKMLDTNKGRGPPKA
jgi:hypothetical protein